jgi:hypothetical protein
MESHQHPDFLVGVAAWMQGSNCICRGRRNQTLTPDLSEATTTHPHTHKKYNCPMSNLVISLPVGLFGYDYNRLLGEKNRESKLIAPNGPRLLRFPPPLLQLAGLLCT